MFRKCIESDKGDLYLDTGDFICLGGTNIPRNLRIVGNLKFSSAGKNQL